MDSEPWLVIATIFACAAVVLNCIGAFMIQVTNLVTGEVRRFKGTLMVAPNGMAFIKSGSETVWCSASTNFVSEKI